MSRRGWLAGSCSSMTHATIPLPAAIPGPTTGHAPAFEDSFREEFSRRYLPLARYLARLTDDDALAADLAQEAFVRLFRRGTMPDDAGAWLVSVAHNLLRNDRQQTRRRTRLLGTHANELGPCSATPSPDAEVEANERRTRVRSALAALPERDRRMLLLRYEGFSYREIATALELHEGSVGTLLARAKDAFRAAFTDGSHASD